MRTATAVIVVGLLVRVGAAQDVMVPVGGGGTGIEELKLVPLGGIEAKVEEGSVDGEAAKTITFTKTEETRRLLALEGRPGDIPAGIKALEMTYRLTLEEGEARLAVVIYDDAGGAWYKTGNAEPAGDALVVGRLPVQSPRVAAFSQAEGDLDWSTVEKVWVGIVIDGKAKGTLDLASAQLTSAAYKPARPLDVTIEPANRWSIGKDPAVTATMTTADEGRDGQVCTKLEFNFVGGRHMYLTPSTTLPAAELDGYTGLEFTYKATLPEGIEGLLVMLTEGGGQFLATPMPKASEDWVTVTIPFADFELGGWSKDDNGKLDLERIGGLIIGTHGGATGKGGDGLIMVSDVKFVP